MVMLLLLVSLVSGHCPSISPGKVVGTVRDPKIDEASGLVSSKRHADLFWTLNDSGASAKIYGISSSGATQASLELVGAKNVDWEALEIGPCKGKSGDCIYIADIGDNRRRRDNLTLYLVPEPEVLRTDLRTDKWDLVKLRYPGGRKYNAESILLDVKNDQFLILTKDMIDCQVFSASLNFSPGDLITLESTRTFLVSLFATDATTVGDKIMVRNNITNFYWQRQNEDQSLLDVLRTSQPCALPVEVQVQGESLALDNSGSSYYVHSENCGDYQNIVQYFFI